MGDLYCRTHMRIDWGGRDWRKALSTILIGSQNVESKVTGMKLSSALDESHAKSGKNSKSTSSLVIRARERTDGEPGAWSQNP